MASLNGIVANARKVKGPTGEPVYHTKLYAKNDGELVEIGEWRQGVTGRRGLLWAADGFSKDAIRDVLSDYGAGFFSDNVFLLSSLSEYERWYKMARRDGAIALLIAECDSEYIGRYVKPEERNKSPEDLLRDERAELIRKYPAEEIRVLAFTKQTDFILGEPRDIGEFMEKNEENRKTRKRA